MNKVEIPDLALDLMLMGGQTFCWDRIDKNHYIGFDRKGLIEIKYDGSALYWQTYPEKDIWIKVSNYFRLDLEHNHIHDLIFFDEFVKKSHAFTKTIKILNQDFEVAFFSFILSQNNSLPIIRHRVRKLAEKYGKDIQHNGKKYYLFPETEILASADLNDLKNCKLGYRADYVKNGAAHLMKNKDFFKKLGRVNINKEEEIRNWLMEVKGIGEKVADCILLYGLNFDNVFPMDLWGKRIIHRFYGISENAKYSQLRNWVKAYFKGYAGWAGQYLFEYARINWSELNELNKINVINK